MAYSTMAAPALKPWDSTPAAPASARRGEPWVTANDLFWCLYLYPLRLFAALAPRALLYQIGRLAEPFVQLCWRERKKDLVRRMLRSRCPGLTADEAPRIARRYVSNALFRGLDDLIISGPAFRRALRCTAVEGLDHLERAKAAGKGVLVLSAHFSANRIAKKYLAAIGQPMLTVRNQLLYEGAGRLGRRFLQPRYVKFQHQLVPDEVDARDPECALKIFQRLRTGELVHILYDVQHRTAFVRGHFLGLERRLPAGTLRMVRFSGCAVVPMLCLGNSAGFRIVFSPMLNMVNAATPDEFAAANLPSFVKTLERQIAEHPAEWVLWNRL